MNKLTTPKLISYNGKMSTNNMIKSKPPKPKLTPKSLIDVDISIGIKQTPRQDAKSEMKGVL